MNLHSTSLLRDMLLRFILVSSVVGKSFVSNALSPSSASRMPLSSSVPLPLTSFSFSAIPAATQTVTVPASASFPLVGSIPPHFSPESLERLWDLVSLALVSW